VDFADVLFPLLVILPFIDWTAAILLLLLARQEPHIDFLTERAAIAVVTAIMTTVYALVALNTQLDFAVLDRDVALVVVRSAVIFLGLMPIFWLLLFLSRRKG
jgi:hypothetical protein